MSKTLLILDYSVDGKSGNNIKRWFSCPVTAGRIVDGSPFPGFDPSDFMGVVHSGSALSITDDPVFLRGAADFIRNACRKGVPQMGICYGHQLLAKALLGPEAVGKAPSIEIGWLPVDFLETWPVHGLRGLKRVWQSHYDCVNLLPEGSVITATNDHTPVQAFLNMELRLFGTQFHPEFDRESGNHCFAENPGIFTDNGLDMEAVLKGEPDLNTGSVIFGHFMQTFGLEM